MSNSSAYGVLLRDTEHELEIKRSRFLCYLARVSDEQTAREHFALVHAEHPTARHHCTAFVLGPRRATRRSNDDGEPSGTAGVPMLDALVRFVRPGCTQPDLSDVAAVVVRYFGGVLLGAGGLVRAYSDAVSQTLANADFVTRARRALFTLDAPIAQAGRWENELRAAGIQVLGTDYAEQSTLHLAVDDSKPAREELAARVAAITAGSASCTPAATQWVDVSLR